MTLGTAYPITIWNEEFQLLPEKAVWWPRKKALLVADLHVGKSTDFRKGGFICPPGVVESDLERLGQLVSHYQAKELIVVGDLFHNQPNAEHSSLFRWRKNFSSLLISLVKGNHDRISEQILIEANIQLMPLAMERDAIRFTHEPTDHEKFYTIHGHIHPAVRLSGKGKQSETLPCFCFGERSAVLPAFGSFTGKFVIDPKESDRVFVIAGSQVIAI